MEHSSQFRISTARVALHVVLTAAAILLTALFIPASAQGQDFSVLYRFSTFAGGFHPYGVIMDRDGNLYGPNPNGGKVIGNGICQPQQGCGTLFKLSPTGVETTLYTFGARPSGKGPSNLLRDSDGNLYGTAGAGVNGHGVIFKLSPTSHETILYAFAGPPADGDGPADLIRDSAGNFYGATAQGGAFNGGTIFKLDTLGVETVLHSFDITTEGNLPSGLVRDAAGNIYGVTGNNGTLHFGTVFKLDTAGTLTTLYNFTGDADGGSPQELVQAADGTLYGTTYFGGPFGLSGGTVFKLDTSGTLTTLHSFGADGDGYIPGPLLLGTDGNLYGTTGRGGPYNFGTVYKLTLDGTETILHFFSGRVTNDGLHPQGKLLRDSNGNLYGTTYGAGGGVVYKIALPH